MQFLLSSHSPSFGRWAAFIFLALLVQPLNMLSTPPLEYVTGDLRQEDGRVIISWVTVWESDLSHFSIHHSSDRGENYVPIEEYRPAVGDKDNQSSYSSAIGSLSFGAPIPSGWNHFKVLAHDLDGLMYKLIEDSVYFTDLTTPVLPGDANSDGFVNVWDFVALCSVMGATGPQRPNATTAPVQQPGLNWVGKFSNGANYKHADCDGNGVVEYADALVIRANYGSLVLPELQQVCGSLPIRLVYPDSASAGDTIDVEIWLGSEVHPVENVFGFAMGFACDTANIDQEFVSFQLDSSWLGIPGQDLDVLTHGELLDHGWCDIAVSRTDGLPRTGHGRVACLSIVMVDDIAKDELERLLAPTIQSGWVANAELKQVFWSGPEADVNSTLLSPFAQGPTLLEEGEIRIFPNPFTNYLIVYGDMDGSTKTIELYDASGKLIRTDKFLMQMTSVFYDDLPPGVYFARVHTPNTSHSQTMIKIADCN